MMTSVDEILAIIDTGLQTAGDIAYGNDAAGVCWRCREPAETDLCAPCWVALAAEVPAEMDADRDVLRLPDLPPYRRPPDTHATPTRLNVCDVEFRSLTPVERDQLSQWVAPYVDPAECYGFELGPNRTAVFLCHDRAAYRPGMDHMPTRAVLACRVAPCPWPFERPETPA